MVPETALPTQGPQVQPNTTEGMDGSEGQPAAPGRRLEGSHLPEWKRRPWSRGSRSARDAAREQEATAVHGNITDKRQSTRDAVGL